ncbi:hypothetical protein ACFLXF_02055 [Chloroflexota bacterium]
MNNYKLILIAIMAVLLTGLLVGCGGVPVEQYDGVAAQLREAQKQNVELQSEINQLEAQSKNLEAELEASKAQAGQLQSQISGLKEEYELVGKTQAETAEKIVKYYHETHVYSTYDLFVCSDMASEVWNMLKAQGINAIIVVGDIDMTVSDIILCDHAWVLAEVAPGEYLALEATGGYVVPESKNPLYYRGWFFDSPSGLKSHNELVREYNVRVEIRNNINDEANEVAKEYNQATSPQVADRLKAVFDKLVELREAQEAELSKINAELKGLATEL